MENFALKKQKKKKKACAPLVILTSQEMSIDWLDMQQEVT